MKRLSLFICLLLLLVAGGRAAESAPVVWFSGGQPVTYCVEGKAAAVVEQALSMFRHDMQLVTGLEARPAPAAEATIRLWQLEHAGSSTRQWLRSQGVPVDSLLRVPDAFYVGIGRDARPTLLVVGSNGRGCAYGLLELSRLSGVSPWVWWGDVVPERRDSLVLPPDFSTLQCPSVAYRGIFINDEDWSLRPWACHTFDPTAAEGTLGPKTYKALFQLLLRLRANTLWPAMHPGTAAFFSVEGNRQMADSFGIVVGTSHCEPLLRNNVAEWNTAERGPYNYTTNRQGVQRYWAERLREVSGQEVLFTLGMRGIHDGPMEGVAPGDRLEALQQVIDDQRQLLRHHYSRRVERVPQVFIPYKEVLETMEQGLRLPDDVTLMWCDDNYGYLTRLGDSLSQQRSGGAGIYYHLSYWGRPHDYLWLTTTQPGLIFHQLRTAYDRHCRRLWIANVHDPKVAAYQLELFLDMAWNIDGVRPTTLSHHLEQWLSTQFGPEAGRLLVPVMQEYYRLCAIRRPEFMGWTQVELDKRKVPGGKSPVGDCPLTLAEACQRLAAFGALEAAADEYLRLVPQRLHDAYFAAVLYPIHAAAAMNRKLLSDAAESRRAYEQIQSLTERYGLLAGGKWRELMSAAPRGLPVFGEAHLRLAHADSTEIVCERVAASFNHATAGCQAIQMLGHSMQAVDIPAGGELTFRFTLPTAISGTLTTATIPTHPLATADLRYQVQVDNLPPVIYSLKEPFRSERWKENVLRQQALRSLPVSLTAGEHTLRIRALDDHIVVDGWKMHLHDS